MDGHAAMWAFSCPVCAWIFLGGGLVPEHQDWTARGRSCLGGLRTVEPLDCAGVGAGGA